MRLSPDLVDWFDAEIWQQVGKGEFNQAVSPDMLLADSPEVIWPGLMLPDTLPLLGNRYGDWLCLRVGADNGVGEVIHWYHGGGDWIPWGKSLAEAVYFDFIRDWLPGRRFNHAIAAEPQRKGDSSDVLLRWALRWLPAEATQILSDRSLVQNSEALAQQLIRSQISDVAVTCELVLNALDSEVRHLLTPDVASQLGIGWEPDAVSWLFDCSLIGVEQRRQFSNLVGRQVSFEQDWELGARLARRICSIRGDLGWAFDVSGWAAERAGRMDEAIGYYEQGALAFAFADQSIRFRTHWFAQASGKFSIWRLQNLPKLGSSAVDGMLQAIEGVDAMHLREQATAYWVDQSQVFHDAQEWSHAYDANYRAGWDLGIHNMSDFGGCLKGLCESAEKAGQTARAAVAKTHYDGFLSRFG